MLPNTIAILNDIKNQMPDLINAANDNADCKGYGIIFGNYSINIPFEDQEEFFEELEDIQQEHNVYFSVSDYNDLVMETEEYESEEF